jgi:DNA-binding MarR family transcriptional regulator
LERSRLERAAKQICVSTTEEGQEFWAELKAAGKHPRDPHCRLCQKPLPAEQPAPHYALLTFEVEERAGKSMEVAAFVSICKACGESLLLRGRESGS